MRFYKIVIRAQGANGALFTPPSMKGMNLTDASYTSLVNGRQNPAALDVYLNIPAYFFSNPDEGAVLRISGVSLDDISQITHLVDHDIWVYAGMLDGYLPLSKHFNPDLLVQGTITYTQGNWEPNNTTLDIYIGPSTTRNPALGAGAIVNVAFNWEAGQPLEPALRKFLQQAYGKSTGNPGGADIQIAISNQLVARTQFPGVYPDFVSFAKELKAFTQRTFPGIQRLDKSAYRGVDILFQNNVFKVQDGTQAPTAGGSGHTNDTPLQIQFVELIGQPTWKTSNLLNFKTIMRGDIGLGDYVTFQPSTLAAPYVLTQSGNGPQSAPNIGTGLTLPSKLTFGGKFQVTKVLHSGQFRQPSGHGWVTTVDAFVPAPSTVPILTSPGPQVPVPTLPPPTAANAPFQLFPPLTIPPPTSPPAALPPFSIPGLPTHN